MLTRETRQVLQVEQEPLIFPEHTSTPGIYEVAQCLVWYGVFCWPLTFYLFCCYQWIVRLSLIYSVWLTICCIQTLHTTQDIESCLAQHGGSLLLYHFLIYMNNMFETTFYMYIRFQYILFHSDLHYNTN